MTISREPLWNKAKVFLERAIKQRDQNCLDEFLFWSTVALEVLGKSALAHVHPALVADPTDFESLLAACGHPVGTDFRTIMAKTVFSRCKRLVRGFDDTCEKFCLNMANLRNADLHSGAVPFAGMSLTTWQPKFWHCVKLLAETQGETLESLLGSEEAESAEAIINDASQALGAAVNGRINHHRLEFESDRSAEERKHVAAAARIAIEAQLGEEDDPFPCPACGCVGQLSGTLAYESDEERDPDEPWIVQVRCTYQSEAFRCVACKLALHGQEELDAAEIPTAFEKEIVKEAYEEEPYGND